MRAGLFWLNDGQWGCIEPHLPTNLTGPEREDDRRVISGIMHMMGLFAVAPAIDYRYAQWMVATALLGAVMIFATRLKASSRSRPG